MKAKSNMIDKREEHIFYQKLISKICLTILGFLTLIGIFFGKEGYMMFGAITLILCILMIMGIGD